MKKTCMAFILILTILFRFPISVNATAKVSAKPDCQTSRIVKRGKTVITVGNPKITKARLGYVKFIAPSSRSYRITFAHIRQKGKSSIQSINNSYAVFSTPADGYNKSLSIKQNGEKTYTLYLCSDKTWAVSTAYHAIKTNCSSSIPRRTAKIALKKRQILYIGFANLKKYPMNYDLMIQ